MPTFGHLPDGVDIEPRRAAYALMGDSSGRVAAVRGPRNRYWLPGGGSKHDEAEEETVRREVLEELGWTIHVQGKVAEAVQIFFAADVSKRLRMHAVFLRAELKERVSLASEHPLIWLPPSSLDGLFYHRSHAWAVSQWKLETGDHGIPDRAAGGHRGDAVGL